MSPIAWRRAITARNVVSGPRSSTPRAAPAAGTATRMSPRAQRNGLTECGSCGDRLRIMVHVPPAPRREARGIVVSRRALGGALLLCTSAVACADARSSPAKGELGREGWLEVTCRRNQDHCVQKASELCQGRGYEVAENTGQYDVGPSAPYYEGRMLIRCETPATVAEPTGSPAAPLPPAGAGGAPPADAAPPPTATAPTAQPPAIGEAPGGTGGVTSTAAPETAGSNPAAPRPSEPGSAAPPPEEAPRPPTLED